MGRFTFFTSFFLALALSAGARANVTVRVKEIRGGYSLGYDTATSNRYFFEVKLVSNVRESCFGVLGCDYHENEYTGHALSRTVGTLGSFSVSTNELATYSENARASVLTIPSAAIEDFKGYVMRRSSYPRDRQSVKLMISARERRGWFRRDTSLDSNYAQTNQLWQTIRFTHINRFTAELEVNGRE